MDGTFGRGGHSGAILAQLGAAGRLLALDRDPEACRYGLAQWGADPRFTLLHAPFASLAERIQERGEVGQADGILLDLGVSSPQLDDGERGFSWRTEAPLDMRMDSSRGETAAEWLAEATLEAITAVLFEYGEERYGRRIAQAIVKQREAGQPITTTTELARVVAAAHPKWERDRHPATRTFQAIRIQINRELEQLDQFLATVIPLLAPAGRLVIISFHSLEDRRVKRFMRDAARGDPYPPDLPIPAAQLKADLRLIGKAITPSEADIAANPRCRSAVMRVAERVAA